ncbi:histo-blood group ABO system transferase 1-like [Oncorhynchus mykiss]|uniref:histo-blood group ABO system transferase 1-like n=1 Tax=Oncorhynchus mykiss TaxID=8022 RepID=UPI0018789D8F|nr:histo-blood group ABO system transferase 1-like [Oncorhynchus mykiss]
MKFYQRWEAEVLSQLVAAVHLSYYYESWDKFPYECRPASLSFVPLNEGDFYYARAVFGGTVEEVHKLTRTCQEHLDRDRVNVIEAAWQEAKHLNCYLIYNKPTRLLSPEYI